ncbi:CPBP family intramembrane metalloprotease [Clostridium botulinum]|uniref:CPBP family intramembrane glutamic endopeptidase n=1 Tax=Clostridium botulinum TaxID=1491 RepID=UPI00224752BF|nr:CPBP family intramembrane glutamic endopeptidase [Clostridium botulinum]UZP03899.1 CPBP family intramembrane metalloprotease [Clostridium botulinum]UZP07255.1 CPBP family intramembrane metalloprotease [Clostridium botulinum]UZP10637.1 CPBP family intramembrane metalloprotease [Clostridium botulinum]
MLLMLFSGYIVINLITNAIINILHIIEPVLESDNEICEISPITSYIFFIGITIISPIIEEFFFRGLFLIKLKDNCNPIFALIFSSLMFCCLHYYGYGQISAFITALLLGIIALKTNTIFYTIIGHILFNLLTTIFGIVSDHSNIINIINRTFHFNIVINIASIIIFIITCFILLKFQLNKKHIPYIK